MAPLSAFGFADDAAGESLQWHDSAAGLATVVALKQSLETTGGDDELVHDLAAIATALDVAAKQDVSFCFILRSGRDQFISPMEMDRRAGSLG
ncbi:MAG TPA: hypothetical protein VFN10_06505 [Thermoanaerobaculia bacterium]|nr:hypothetical protein [Thermoanaerobaculia bacterium]